MHTELQPRSFWWWCCGGLKVYDALIVTGYLIVNVLYVEQRYVLYLTGLKRALPSPWRGIFEECSTFRVISRDEMVWGVSQRRWRSTMGSSRAGIISRPCWRRECMPVPAPACKPVGPCGSAGLISAWHVGRLGGSLAWAATPNLMLLFYPVPRSSFLLWMLGQNFEQLVKYHKCGTSSQDICMAAISAVRGVSQECCPSCRWIGNWSMILLTLHGWCFWASWLWEGIYIRGFYWDTYGSNMLAGALSWFAGAALWVTSLSYVRRNYFEVRNLALSFGCTDDGKLSWTSAAHVIIVPPGMQGVLPYPHSGFRPVHAVWLHPPLHALGLHHARYAARCALHACVLFMHATRMHAVMVRSPASARASS